MINHAKCATQSESDAGSKIESELWLPKVWNGKLLGIGSHSFGGSLFADLWLGIKKLPGSFKTVDGLGIKFFFRNTCVDPNREITFW